MSDFQLMEEEAGFRFPPPDPAIEVLLSELRSRRGTYLDEHFSVSGSPRSRVWLVGADFGFGCITFETMDYRSPLSRSVGEMQDWVAEAIQDVGWESVLDAYKGDEYAGWLIENGIAPGQPFRVEISPSILKSYDGDYGYDYDLEMDAEVIAVARWSPERVRAAWDRWAQRYLAEPAKKALASRDGRA